MAMSTQSSLEYLNSTKKRYQKAKSKDAKIKIIDEVDEIVKAYSV